MNRGAGHDPFTKSVNVVEDQPKASNEEGNPSLRDFFHPNQFAPLRLAQDKNFESTSSTTAPSDGGDISSSEHAVEEHHDTPFTNSEDSSVDEDVVGATSNESDSEGVAVRGRRSSRSPRPRRRKSGSSRSPIRSLRPRRSRSPA